MFLNYINGKWHQGHAGIQEVINPATGQVIGQLSMCDAEDVDAAVKAAKLAEREMEAMSVFARSDMLYGIADAIIAHQDELAEILCKEHGKPIQTAISEVGGSAAAFREVGEQIKWIKSEIIPFRTNDKICMVLKKPKGAFGVITPWNYPLGAPTKYFLAPGLAAGCPLVWNPATSTAAVSSVLMKAFEEAGLPAGFLSLVIGKGSVVGEALSVHPDLAGIGFIGSTEIGKQISARAGSKYTMMELGGNGPVIVLRDADLELAAEKILAGSVTNAGQICTSTERVLADDSIADRLVALIDEKLKAVVLGDPYDPATTMGPMHSKDTILKVHQHIADALAGGARLVTGGGVKQGMPTDHYIEATLLDHVAADSLLNREETFGPVIPIIRFKEEAEIEALIARSSYRLFAAIFTRDIDKALSMAQTMKFGAININESSSFWDHMLPAGGGGGSDSGHGRSGGWYSIRDFSEERLVVINLQTKRPKS